MIKYTCSFISNFHMFFEFRKKRSECPLGVIAQNFSSTSYVECSPMFLIFEKNDFDLYEFLFNLTI